VRATALEAAHPGPYLFHHSRQFVPEQSGRNNHAGVIPPLVHLQISAAGEGDLHFDQDFSVRHSRDRNFFDLDVLFAV